MRIEHLRVVPTPFTSFNSSCIFAAWDDHERHVTLDLKINFLYCLDVFVGLRHKLCQFLGGDLPNPGSVRPAGTHGTLFVTFLRIGDAHLALKIPTVPPRSRCMLVLL